MRKLLFFTIAAICANNLIAQKQPLNYQQAFGLKPTIEIIKPLPAFVSWQNDDKVLVSQKNASGMLNYTLVNIKTGQLEAIDISTKSPSTPNFEPPKEAKNFTYSANQQYAAYTLNNNLYTVNIATQKTTQVTFDGSENIKNGYASWVYYEEILGRASRYKAFWFSNNGMQIAFMRFNDTQVPIYPLYVNTGQHGYLENEHYPKVGDKNPTVKIGIYNIETNTTTWANFNENDDQYFGQPYFTPTNQLFIQWLNRGQDNYKIYNVDIANGSKTEVYNENQKTWIDLDDNNRIQFLEDGKHFILRSDKTGWLHYYLYDMNGNLINTITQGEFTVGNILKIDEKNKTLYFLARKENSARWDVYSTSFDGKNLSRLSFGNYNFSNVNISPNNKYFIATYSNLLTPDALAIIDFKGNIVKEIANTKGTDFNTYNLPQKQLVRVKTDDGLFNLPVSITYPINFDANKKYPVLVSVYGGPNAGRVYDVYKMPTTDIWWAQEGLIQVAIDNRSSGHFGKVGMNFIHRQLGIYEIKDFITVGNWLKQQTYVDTTKLCITGGSFGGYITCMALTYGANTYNFGIANSSVTDWQLYDSHYTERYMDLPTENIEGYKKTAVFAYTNQYKGLLRIVHGTSDDNVHPQNSLQLINKLQDEKKHFEFMMYPGERHGFVTTKAMHNRVEAYKFYYNNLLGKPLPNYFWQ